MGEVLALNTVDVLSGERSIFSASCKSVQTNNCDTTSNISTRYRGLIELRGRQYHEIFSPSILRANSRMIQNQQHRVARGIDQPSVLGRRGRTIDPDAAIRASEQSDE
jgi:hypothetical protein